MVATRTRPEIGGIEAHVAEVAARLAGRVDLEVLTTDRTGELPRRERVETPDGASYVVRRFRAFPRGRDWYASPGLGLALLRARADVVHVQGVHTLVPPLALLVALLRRLPVLLTFHSGGSSSAFRTRVRGLQWRLLAPLLRRADLLVGVSEYERDRFADVVDGPVTLVRNGGALPDPGAVEVDRGLVVSNGRLERYKGHQRAVAMLPHLVETHPDARLRILGSGPQEAELLEQAARLGVADRVEVHAVDPDDRVGMAREVAAAGAALLLSEYEAHPVAVMEALDLGRPVVVARTSGLTELADLGWARGVEIDADPATTARAVAAQLDDPVLPPHDALPTWDGCADALHDLYLGVLADRTAGPAPRTAVTPRQEASAVRG
ncbi:MAG: glycosyl transferase family 1 [Nocardioides sp.]|nr:glycosyl transferase family 1 [Nocardioides sp.]